MSNDGSPDTRLTPEQRRIIDSWLEQASATDRPAIERRPDRSEAPLSSAQERLWFIDRLRPGATIYCLPTLVGLDGPLDRVALERSLAEILRRHEPLRTRFPTRAGRAVQVPGPAGGLDLVDLAAFPPERRAVELERLA